MGGMPSTSGVDFGSRGNLTQTAPTPKVMTSPPVAAHMSPMAEVKILNVAEGEDGVRLDRWLRRRWPHLGQAQIHKLARSGQIRVDGARAKADTRLSAGSVGARPAAARRATTRSPR